MVLVLVLVLVALMVLVFFLHSLSIIEVHLGWDYGILRVCMNRCRICSDIKQLYIHVALLYTIT